MLEDIPQFTKLLLQSGSVPIVLQGQCQGSRDTQELPKQGVVLLQGREAIT